MKIPLSVLDLAPVIEGSTAAESFRRTVELAQHVEQWGYRRFWLAEHHSIPGVASAATAVLIGHVAGATKTLRVGSGGIMLPNHAPLVIAEQFGTLEALYPGRIDLGLGRAPGSDQATARALHRDERAADEFPRHVQELLAYLGPVQPGQRVVAIPGANARVPVWLLGSSTFSAQLAAAFGLPFAFAGQFAPAQMFEALRLYRENFQASEFLEKPYAMIGLPVLAAETDAEAQRLATSAQQQVLALIRRHPIPVPPPIETLEGNWDSYEKAAVAAHLGVAIIGGPETVRAKIEDFAERTGADELMVHSQFYHQADRLRSYEIVSGLIE